MISHIFQRVNSGKSQQGWTKKRAESDNVPFEISAA